MIHVDYVITCDNCHSADVIEHNDLHVGERPPAVMLPPGWNGVDTGRTLCPKCSEDPEPQKKDGSKDHAPFCGT